MKRITVALLAFSLMTSPVWAQTPKDDQENRDEKHWQNGDQGGDHKEGEHHHHHHHHHHHKDQGGENGGHEHHDDQGGDNGGEHHDQ